MKNKEIKKECCKDKNNMTVKSKTYSYREICCKKCGYIINAIDIDKKER